MNFFFVENYGSCGCLGDFFVDKKGDFYFSI